MNRLTCPLALVLMWSTRLIVTVDPSLPIARTLIVSCETLLFWLMLVPNHAAKCPEYVTVPTSGVSVNHASCVDVIHTSPAALTVMWNTALPVPVIVPAGAPQVESTWNGENAPWKFCVDEVAPAADAGAASTTVAASTAKTTSRRLIIRLTSEIKRAGRGRQKYAPSRSGRQPRSSSPGVGERI